LRFKIGRERPGWRNANYVQVLVQVNERHLVIDCTVALKRELLTIALGALLLSGR
jgi:hypothetical protein